MINDRYVIVKFFKIKFDLMKYTNISDYIEDNKSVDYP